MVFSCWMLVLFSVIATSNGILFPKDSPSRLVKDLNGVWHFRVDDSTSKNASFEEKWYSKPLAATGQVIKMPVPASFNDITSNSSIRDFFGWAWYDRNFWVPSTWLDGKTRIVLRFESAHYHTIVWVNGEQVMEHIGGHLPFEADITKYLKNGVPNRVTAAVNNTMTPHTIPPGEIIYHGPPDYPSGYIEQKIKFDFYNYAGINRDVKLYTTPETYIDDIAVKTTLQDNGDAKVYYDVLVKPSTSKDVTCKISLLGTSASGQHDVTDGQVSGVLNVHKPTLWWPWTMSDTPGYLYPLEVYCTDKESGISDFYRLAIGIREVKVTDTQFLINGKPFYLNGVDKHEDWDTIGKGIDIALIMKDIYLLKWLGVAAFRTSHYPYAEEILQLCDQEGIAVILESPAVGLGQPENFDMVVLLHHLQVMEEIIARDKNKPSIVMWSVANAPNVYLDAAVPYFKTVVNLTRTLDPTRPVSFAHAQGGDYKEDNVNKLMDVIMINQYFGWYHDTGHLEVIDPQMRIRLDNWHSTFKKPIIISEYGAGSLPGTHKEPGSAWSEEYQAESLMSYWSAFDDYRKKFLVGELIWNFADIKTEQGTSRPDGNRKGILTRQRQPKLAAHVVRERYHSLAKGRDYHPESIFAK